MWHLYQLILSLSMYDTAELVNSLALLDIDEGAFII